MSTAPTPAPPPGAGESDIQAKLRAIQAKQAAQLIAVQTKYKEEVRKQDEEYDKRWNELNKSSTPPVAVKEEEVRFGRHSETKELITREGEVAIGFHLHSKQARAYKKVFQAYALHTLIPLFTSGNRDPKFEVLPQVLEQAHNVLAGETQPVEMEGAFNKVTSVEVADRITAADNKFKFLDLLFQKLRQNPLSMLVLANSVSMRRKIEALCVASGLAVTVYNEGRPPVFIPGPAGFNGLKVSIAATSRSTTVELKPMHLVIAMDDSFDPKAPHVRQARQSWYNSNEETPVIRLFYFNTMEQLGFVYAPLLEEASQEQKQDLLKYSFTNLLAQGAFQTYPNGPSDLAESIASWINSVRGKPKVKLSAYVPRVPDLEVVLSFSSDSQPRASAAPSSSVASPAPEVPDSGAESEATKKRKRHLEDLNMTKRVKPEPEILDVRRQPVDAGGSIEVYDENFSYDNLTKDELIFRLRTQYQRYCDVRNSLDTNIEEQLMNRESYTNIKKEVERLELELERANERAARLRDSNDAVKQERTELYRRVRELQNAIDQGDASEEVKKWKDLEAENVRLKEQLEKKDAQVKSRDDELSFIRNQYQSTSSKASQMSNELEDLRAENEDLKKKADENLLRLRGMAFFDERRKFHSEIAGYQAVTKLQGRRIETLTKQLEVTEKKLDKSQRELDDLVQGTRSVRSRSQV